MLVELKRICTAICTRATSCNAMESSRIEPKDPGIKFDLLKDWISHFLHRRIKNSTPSGCPWQALASALQELSRQQCRNQSSLAWLGAEKRYTEFDVRQTEEVRREEDPPSIFSLGSYRNAKEIMNHWDWYLSCLCGTQQELKVMRSSYWLETPLPPGRAMEELCNLPCDACHGSRFWCCLQRGHSSRFHFCADCRYPPPSTANKHSNLLDI